MGGSTEPQRRLTPETLARSYCLHPPPRSGRATCCNWQSMSLRAAAAWKTSARRSSLSRDPLWAVFLRLNITLECALGPLVRRTLEDACIHLRYSVIWLRLHFTYYLSYSFAASFVSSLHCLLPRLILYPQLLN